MIISIDGQPIDPSRIRGRNLEEILAELMAGHLGPDKIIGDVLVNGSSYSEDLPHAAVEIDRTDIQTLELVTRSSEEIALNFLKHGPAIIDDLLAAIPHITEIFRLGDEAEASEHFLRFLESLHLLLSMIDQAGRALALSFDVPMSTNESLNERLAKLAETLTQILDIQKQTDWIYLADVLDYELNAELEALRDLLPQIKAHAH
ncbi:MAG: hypothetical protein KKB20_14810 [Proteobacteria bacterium]|nr:hypothetical protein [Pseudomonadota bacterium]